jgi:hypothetical protein
MTDTNQLPEPDLGYIKTDISNQPAFSARQMREAMLVCGAQNAESDSQASLSLTAAPQWAGVTDADIDAVTVEQWGEQIGVMLQAHRAYARAILALRPERVPMTDDERREAYLKQSKSYGYRGTFMRGVWAAEAHHDIKTDKSNQPAFSARQMREMKDTNQLPPLPEPEGVIVVGTQALRGFTADQMCAFALQACSQVQGEPIGEVGTMPGTSGFTMACFRADEAPVGTKIYTTPQPAQATQAEAQQPATGASVAYVDRDGFIIETGLLLTPGTKLYTRPAPSVPDAIASPVEDGTEYDYCSGQAAGYAEGWNACRAAMLAAK